MKKKQRNGLKIGQLQFRTKENSKLQNLFAWGLDYILLTLLILSAFGCFLSGYQIPVHKKILVTGIVLENLLFGISFTLKKKGEILFFGTIVFFIGISIRKINRISVGLAIIVNHVLKIAQEYYALPEVIKYQAESDQQALDVSLFLLFVGMFLTGLLSYLVARNRGKYIMLVLTILFVLAPEIVGEVPKEWYFVGYVIAMLSFFGNSVRKKRRNSVGKNIQCKIRLYQIVCAMLVLGISMKLVSKVQYQQATENKNIKQTVQYVLEDIYNNTLRMQIDSGVVNGGINCGRLSGIDKIEYNNKVKLLVTMNKGATQHWADYENSVRETETYIRGYVGSAYENSEWKPLSEDQEKEKDRLEAENPIDLEEYRVAVASTLTKLDQFYSIDSCFYEFNGNVKNVIGKRCNKPATMDFFARDYNKESLMADLDTRVASPAMSAQKITVKNVSETLKTVFNPYGQLGNIEEKEGRFSSSYVENPGEYTLPYLNYSNNLAGAPVTNKMRRAALYEGNWDEDFGYEYVSERVDMKLLWKNMLAAIKKIKKYFGITISDYQEGTYKGEKIEKYEEEFWEVNPELKSRMDMDAYFSCLKHSYEIYKKEQRYEAFVKKAYTNVPEELQPLMAQIREQCAITEDTNIYDTIALVQTYLNNHTEYTLEPGRVPEGEDFITYFLTKNKKGFCVHYATAATMIFRSAGIPARYAEGYVLDVSRLKAKEENKEAETATYELTDQDAHAWVEVYLEGFGWIPVEVTKGYMGVTNIQRKPIKDKTEADIQITPTSVSTSVPQKQQTTTQVEQNTDTKSDTVKFDWGKWKTEIIIVLSIVGVVIFVYLRKILVELYRRKRAVKGSLNEQAQYAFTEIERILKRTGHCKKSQPLREQLVSKTIEVTGIETEFWSKLLDLINEQAFSELGINAKQLQQLQEMQEQIRNAVYAQVKTPKKWFYEYLCLI